MRTRSGERLVTAMKRYARSVTGDCDIACPRRRQQCSPTRPVPYAHLPIHLSSLPLLGLALRCSSGGSSWMTPTRPRRQQSALRSRCRS